MRAGRSAAPAAGRAGRAERCPRVSPLPRDEPAAPYPALRHPGESPPSPFLGRAGPGRAAAVTFSALAEQLVSCHSPTTPIVLTLWVKESISTCPRLAAMNRTGDAGRVG